MLIALGHLLKGVSRKAEVHDNDIALISLGTDGPQQQVRPAIGFFDPRAKSDRVTQNGDAKYVPLSRSWREPLLIPETMGIDTQSYPRISIGEVCRLQTPAQVGIGIVLNARTVGRVGPQAPFGRQ
jgi:hypothetical protein